MIYSQIYIYIILCILGQYISIYLEQNRWKRWSYMRRYAVLGASSTIIKLDPFLAILLDPRVVCFSQGCLFSFWLNIKIESQHTLNQPSACGRVARGGFVGPKGRGFDPPFQIRPSVWPDNWVSNSHSNKWAASRRGVSPWGWDRSRLIKKKKKKLVKTFF